MKQRDFYFNSEEKGDNLMVFYKVYRSKSSKEPSRVLTVQISNFGDEGYRVYMESVDISNIENPVCLKAWEIRLHSGLEEIKLCPIDDATGHLRTEVYYRNLEHPFNIEEFDKNE